MILNYKNIVLSFLINCQQLIYFMEDCLPQNFAEKLIELQSMLDQKYSMEIIQELNQLYRIGIDYYVREQPRKAMHFQKKMTSLLSNPKTLNIFEEPSKNNKQSTNFKSNQNSVNTFEFQSKVKDQVMKFQSYSDQYVKSILQTSQRALKRNHQLKNVDLNKQQKNLEERILLKKVRSQQKLKMLSPRKSRQQN